MDKMQYFPSYKNNYFLGKLLSAKDFQMEQNYFNSKRYFLNNLLYGGGILCGLEVIKVDDQMISIEMGAAIDYEGREIVVDAPRMQKLTTIQGFSYENEKPYRYLCLEYDEEQEERVHSALGEGDKSNYNRCKESYRLYLTDEEGDREVFSRSELYKVTKTIYEDENYAIIQSCPRFLKAGSEFTIQVTVKRLKKQAEHGASISFRYELAGQYIRGEDGKTVEISFDETKQKPAEEYKITAFARAGYTKNVKERLKVQNADFHMGDGSLLIPVEILTDDLENAVRRAYFGADMESLLQASENKKIYLARIHYIGYKNSYIIDKVENVPFGQYIDNRYIQNALLHIRKGHSNQTAETATLDLSRFEKKLTEILAQNIELTLAKPMVASGVSEIEIGMKGRKNSVFFSPEIIHGLGEGLVEISLGQINEKTDMDSIVYGSNELFEKHSIAEKIPMIDTAAKANITEGTFQIGMKLLASTDRNSIKIAWTAHKAGGKNREQTNKKHMRIMPEVVTLRAREEFRFTCELAGYHPEQLVIWSIEGENGGQIDEAGMYKAPVTPGIFEIKVKVGDKISRAFVVVQ